MSVIDPSSPRRADPGMKERKNSPDVAMTYRKHGINQFPYIYQMRLVRGSRPS